MKLPYQAFDELPDGINGVVEQGGVQRHTHVLLPLLLFILTIKVLYLYLYCCLLYCHMLVVSKVVLWDRKC